MRSMPLGTTVAETPGDVPSSVPRLRVALAVAVIATGCWIAVPSALADDRGRYDDRRGDRYDDRYRNRYDRDRHRYDHHDRHHDEFDDRRYADEFDDHRRHGRQRGHRDAAPYRGRFGGWTLSGYGGGPHARWSVSISAPRLLDRVLRNRHARFYRGRVFHAPHRHHHEVYLFPVAVRHGLAYRPHYYCESELYGHGAVVSARVPF